MKFICVLFLIYSLAALAQDEIFVYGPGGPAPAMKQAAAEYGKESGIRVNVTAGPTKDWIEDAKGKGDIIYSGSEHMMTDFVNEMDGLISSEEVIPLYLRPSAVLVRPGNPKNIKSYHDLLKDINILVVNGAGQTGLWEDIAGRNGSIENVKAFRGNIKFFAKNSAEAKKIWTENEELDAWLIWNIWQISNPDIAEVVELEPEFTLYRNCGVVLTKKGKEAPAHGFIEFLLSEKGKAIFKKWGWITD